MRLLQLFPAIAAAVKSVEEFFSAATGAGKEKLSIVKLLIEETYGDVQGLWPSIEKIIARLVAAANALGIFKTSK